IPQTQGVPVQSTAPIVHQNATSSNAGVQPNTLHTNSSSNAKADEAKKDDDDERPTEPPPPYTPFDPSIIH
ncbi:hypothetical protein HDU99_009998, partial [Rhizoclosmatium hyalinum]